jgi:hypothetical protein
MPDFGGTPIPGTDEARSTNLDPCGTDGMRATARRASISTAALRADGALRDRRVEADAGCAHPSRLPLPRSPSLDRTVGVLKRVAKALGAPVTALLA